MTESRHAGSGPRPPRVFPVLLFVTGLCLLIPGLRLLQLGGSAYYVAAGLLAMLSAILLWRRAVAGLAVYAVLLVGTLAWAVWESGLAPWALLPRLMVPLLLGAGLALPQARAGLRRRTRWFPVLVGLIVIGLPTAVILQPNTAPAPFQAPAIGPIHAATADDGDWPEYGRDKAGTRFSPLAQITPANVALLQRVWTYHLGFATGVLAETEVTPLKIRDRLYLCTGNNDVVALDAETGTQVWRFDANLDTTGLFVNACRGVAYYSTAIAGSPCPERILTATGDRRLIALNLATGAPCQDFGSGGAVDLNTGMGPVEPGYYHVTSAPQVVRGRVVVGGWVSDGQYVGEPSGVIRAFDATTGALAWAWDMGRPDDHGLPPPGATYTRGTPNSWAPISADEALGLVYLPTGSATPDYYGGYRTPVDDAYDSAVVALDADTGALRWSFQTTHHDLWDYDVASQPTLVDLPDGRKALIQPTKRGEVFLLNRETGRPIAQVEERKVPQGGVPGEHLAPTQPFSAGMPSFAGPLPTEQRMWGITPFDQLWCRIAFREARFDGSMTPLSTTRPTVTFPGFLGGMNWGGVSVDADAHLMIVNSDRVGNYNRLLTRAEADRLNLHPLSATVHGGVGGMVAQAGTPYAADIRPFLSPLGVPCTQPPFGMISAVDLQTRTLVWSHPFGTGADSGPLHISSHLPFTMGVPNIGGPVTTRGGVFFIGAAQDNYLRAFETATGRELWRGRLPAGGQSTPAVYWSDASRREFVVIAAGGHVGLQTTAGDEIVAYALPRPN